MNIMWMAVGKDKSKRTGKGKREKRGSRVSGNLWEGGKVVKVLGRRET